jgi:hypothetical protein
MNHAHVVKVYSLGCSHEPPAGWAYFFLGFLKLAECLCVPCLYRLKRLGHNSVLGLKEYFQVFV